MKKITNIALIFMFCITVVACAPKGEREANKAQGQAEAQKFLSLSQSDPTMTFLSGKIEMDTLSSIVKPRGDAKEQFKGLAQEFSERLEELKKEDAGLENKIRSGFEFSLIIYENPKDSNEKAKFIKTVDGKEEISAISDSDIHYNSETGDLRCYVGLKDSQEGYVLFSDPSTKSEQISEDGKTKEISVCGIVYKATKKSETENEYFVGTMKLVKKESVAMDAPKKEVSETGSIWKDPVKKLGELNQKPTDSEKETKIQELEVKLQKKAEELKVIGDKLLERSEEEASEADGHYVYNNMILYDFYRWLTGNSISALNAKQKKLGEEVNELTQELKDLKK